MILLASTALNIAPIQAASYPTKQIKLVIPYTAKSSTNLVAHTFANAAKNHLPVSIEIINKPSKSDTISLSKIATARPSSYKIDLGTIKLTTLPSLKMMHFKTSNFKPIAHLNANPATITIHSNAP